MANADLPKSYEDKIKKLEDNVPYMYVDSQGNVTVGLGHNVTAHKDYKSLAFKTTARFERHPVKGGDTGIPVTKDKRAGRTATHQEIQNDYDFLIKHKGLGKYAVKQGTMRKYTTLELDQAEIDRLFAKDLASAIARVKATFGSDFAKYPAPCRAALIDIQFNTGNLSGKFPQLVNAVKGQGAYKGKTEAERWTAAASQSNRRQVDADRNALIKSWFLEGTKP